jgi:hypothetical protein
VKNEMPTGGSSTRKAPAAVGAPPSPASARRACTFSEAKFQYLKKPRNPRLSAIVMKSSARFPLGRGS